MKKRTIIFIMFCLSMVQTYGQAWFKGEEIQQFSSISISMDPNSNLKSSNKNISIEYERSYEKFYARAEGRYVDHPDFSYMELIIGSGIHFSFFKENKDAFYVGLRAGAIHRKSKLYYTVGVGAGINYRLGEKFIVGVRTTMDNRTDLKIWNQPNKFVNSNYIKFGFVF